MTDQEIILLIQDRKEHKALIKLYNYQGKATALVLQYGGSKEDAQDIFQEALLVLCKKVWEGNFVLSSKLDTYVYAICLNILRNELKQKSNKKIHIPDLYQWEDENEFDAIFERERQLVSVEKVLLKVGDPCLKLLKLFYFELKRVKEIVNLMGYKTENSVKVQKFKCIERIKKMM
jgi:RNA polymerase sigma factor (sigma-70 family)